MEIEEAAIKTACKLFEDECVTAHCYAGTSEGNASAIKISMMRSYGLLLGIFSEEELSVLSRKAELKAKTILKKRGSK